MTLGLPIVRTAPDHGTAFDIAGQDRADPRPMAAAIRMAAEMRRPCAPRPLDRALSRCARSSPGTGSARARRSARISSSTANCSRGSRRFPGRSTGQRVYEVGPGPRRPDPRPARAGARVVAVERDRRCLPALAELAEDSPDRLDVIEADALKIDERSRWPATARMSSPTCPTMSAPRCCSLAGRRLAALVAIADPDVPAGGGRADRRRSRAAMPTAAWRCRAVALERRGSR